MTLALPPDWLRRLRERLDRPPAAPRLELRWQGEPIGSVEQALVDKVRGQRPDARELLGLEAGACELRAGHLTEGLAQLAVALRELGLSHAWRNEQLPVVAADGRELGTVERGVVRQLGIATRAVHLVGFAADGRHWVQLRALNKANDPGLWDTLMGGMVPAGQTVEQALARETMEEAGLDLAQLQGIAQGGQVLRRSPTGDGPGGYVVERIDWYRCVVPDGVEPRNLDGEVERFERIDDAALGKRLLADAFTLEAAAILAQAASSRGL